MFINNRVYAAVGIVAGVWLVLSGGSSGGARERSPVAGGVKTEAGVSTRASGTFDVKLNPLAAYDNADGSRIGRMSIDKQFHGELEATSKGELGAVMLVFAGARSGDPHDFARDRRSHPRTDRG
jgi:hypothetical protein